MGTVSIPTDRIVLCFFWGFIRGITGAWSVFLLGMPVIELSKLQIKCSSSPSQNEDADTYEHSVSINTAQSSTAKNVGSFVASVATFVFFAKHRNLEDTVANTLLLVTGVIYFLASLVSLQYQLHVGNLLEDLSRRHYHTVGNVEGELSGEVTTISSTNVTHNTSSFKQSSITEQGVSESVQSDDSIGTSSHTLPPAIEDVAESNNDHRRQIFEVSTLVAFQMLLALSALQEPIIIVSNKKTWVSLVVTFAVMVISIIFLGYRYESKAMMAKSNLSTSTLSSEEENKKLHSQTHRLSHGQINLFFLLRYLMPIAEFLMYSFFYSVFESEPKFLQMLNVLEIAIGSAATFF